MPNPLAGKEEGAVTDNRQRDLAYRDLERIEDEQALQFEPAESDRPVRPSIVYDDRRSSAFLTERERAARWPIG
jgi:hypothetical protein